jgi:hypothetical protein
VCGFIEEAMEERKSLKHFYAQLKVKQFSLIEERKARTLLNCDILSINWP